MGGDENRGWQIRKGLRELEREGEVLVKQIYTYEVLVQLFPFQLQFA